MPTFDETTSLLRDVCEHLNYEPGTTILYNTTKQKDDGRRMTFYSLFLSSSSSSSSYSSSSSSCCRHHFSPTHPFFSSLLFPFTTNSTTGHLNFADYCEFVKEALRTSGLAPKMEELKELFALIDVDDSNTLERHEILHAVMANWKVTRMLANSKTLKPLNNVAQWRRAFDALQQPGEDNKLY